MFDVMKVTTFIWLILGIVLIFLEFAVPGVITIFFGAGALIVGLLTVFLDISINLQIIIFLGFSIVALVFLRKYFKNNFKWFQRKPGKNENEFSDADECIGKSAVAVTDIPPNEKGRVEYKGTAWDAQSEGGKEIQKGDTVLIVGIESIILKVKKD